MDTSKETQQQIEEKKLNAPRILLSDIEAEIESAWYFTGEEGVLGAYKTHDDVYQVACNGLISSHETAAPRLKVLTLCVLVLKNGKLVVGYSAPISAENYNEEVGRKAAYNKAFDQVGDYVAFRMMDKMV